MSPRDLPSEPRDSGAQQLEMPCRTPSLHSTAEWAGDAAAVPVRRERWIYLLGMAALLFRGIGPFSRLAVRDPVSRYRISMREHIRRVDNRPIEAPRSCIS